MRRARWPALLPFVFFLAVGVAAGFLYVRTGTAQELKSLSLTVVDLLLFLLQAPDRLLVPE